MGHRSGGFKKGISRVENMKKELLTNWRDLLTDIEKDVDCIHVLHERRIDEKFVVREVGNGVDRKTRRTRNNRGRCEGPRAGRGVRALRARRTSCGDGKGRVHVVRVIVVRVPVQVNPVVFFAVVICNGRHEDESERKRSRGRSVECGGSEGESKTNRKKNEQKKKRTSRMRLR
jgi:hypothetical protein